jgi:hypothetical protein
MAQSASDKQSGLQLVASAQPLLKGHAAGVPARHVPAPSQALAVSVLPVHEAVPQLLVVGG